MTDEEKENMEEWTVTQEEAESEIYANEKHCEKCINFAECVESAIEDRCKTYRESYKDYLNGLTKGKSKWHDLRKDPNDLPKESDRYLCYWEGGDQWIMDFETEVNSFGYWCNVYHEQSLGFVDSVFETIKERGEDDVIAWCELPKFEE